MYSNFKGKGLFVYSDPAGGNAVLAIIDNLIRAGKKNKIDFFVYSNNSIRLSSKSFDCVQILDSGIGIESIFSLTQPDFLYSATSNNSFEHRFRLKARKFGIYSYSFIDHWTLYRERFEFNNQLEFGDEILVINEIAKKEAIFAGIPSELIKVVGNPFYQYVSSFKPKCEKESFFRKFSLNTKKGIILFVSDNVRESFPKDEKGNCILGYDEYTVLNNLLEGLKTIETEKQLSKYQLVIKIHPLSKEEKFDDLISKHKFENINVSVIKKCDSLTLNYFSSLVVGMFSNMVVESMLLRKNVMRVQIGQKGDDIFKFDFMENVLVTNFNKMLSALRESL